MKLYDNILELGNLFHSMRMHEAFIVIEGEMSIEFRDKTVELRQGEMLVVPKGVEHKPHAENECKIMVVEPAGVVSTGDSDGKLTADNNTWI